MLLDAILANKTLKSESQEDKTLISSKEELKEESKEESKEELEEESKEESKEDDEMDNTLTQEEIKEIVDETMNQNNNNIIEQLNDYLDEIIDESKSFKDQIKLIRKVENLNEYCFINDYGDKEFKIFKLKLPYLSTIIDKKIQTNIWLYI